MAGLYLARRRAREVRSRRCNHGRGGDPTASDPTEPQPPEANAGALERIVAGLDQHPPLLYGLGGAIVLAGLAGVVSGQASLLILAVVLVLLAALAAWVAGSGGRASGDEFAPKARARDVTAQDDAMVQSRRGGFVGRFAPRLKARDVTLGRGSHLQSQSDGEESDRDRSG